jgi:transcriptional regulator with XRE-family HTH domain
MKKFGDWLSDQLKERDMIPADLTRLTGLESGVLSNLINNKRGQPSVDTSKRIAKALNLPLEEVYRAADILPPKPDIDVISQRILNMLLDLPSEDKKDILAYVELRQQLANERENVASVAKKSSRRIAPT